MRSNRQVPLLCVLCFTNVFLSAQSEPPLPKERINMNPWPEPASGSHGHPPDSRPGNAPCSITAMASRSADCAASPNQSALPSLRTYQPPTSAEPVRLGMGAGLLAGLAIWSLTEQQTHQPFEQLSRDGPQFPDSFNISHFQASGFAKGGWPVVVDYEAETGAYVLLTVVTQNAAPAQFVLPATQLGRRFTQYMQLPAEFGGSLKVASFSITAAISPANPSPRFLRIYGFGCGRRAVGSVAIDELRFGPQAVSALQPETTFSFHAHSTFDKMRAEFLQIALVDHAIEGQLFDNKKIDRRIAQGESVNDEWSARKAKNGQIQCRIRGWMTASGDTGRGDWVTAFSPDLVFKH